MSKEKTPPVGKQQHKKGKSRRVVSASVPPPPAPALVKPPAARAVPPAPAKGKPSTPAQSPRPAPREAALEALPAGWHISLEAMLYALLALIALAVRLYALGRFPLQEAEGVRAWAAWGMFRGLPDVTLAGHSPLPVFAATLSFLLFGAGDAAARLLPALAGALCVVLPYALRRELGRVGALVAAALLTIGPTFLLASRMVDGAMIIVAGALVAIACALDYRRTEDDRAIYVAAIALGAMFAADKSAGPTALILALVAVVSWLRSDEEREVPVEGLRKGAIVFLATTVLLGTGLLTNLQGVQTALIDPLTVWITGAGAATVAQRAGFYTRVLLAYEPLVVVFALAAIVAAGAAFARGSGLRLALPGRSADKDDDENEDSSGDELIAGDEDERDFSLTPLLVMWTVLALAFFMLLGDQSPASAVQVVLPMALLAAQFIGRSLASDELRAGGRELWLLMFLFLLIVLAMLPWFNPTNLFGGRFVPLEKRIQNLTAVLLVVVILAMAAVAAWYAYRVLLKGTLLALAVALVLVLGIYTVHSAWQLNHVNWANATEPLLVQRTSPAVRLLLADAVATSRRQGDDAIAITLDDRVPQPVRWYLRQFLNVTTARVGTTTKTPIIIAPVDAKDTLSKSLAGAYVNQRYRLRSTWQAGSTLERWLRWAHVREQINKPAGEDLVAFFRLPQ